MRERASFSPLRDFVDVSRRPLLVAAIASAASGACSALLVAGIGRWFTDVGRFDGASALWFVVLLCAALVTSLYASKVLIDASSGHSRALRLSLCRCILSTDYVRLESIGGHRLIASLSEDMASLSIAFSRVPDIITNATRLFFCVAYLLWLSPAAMSALMVLCVPVVYVQLLLFRRSRARMQDMLPIRDRRYALYESMTRGFKELLVNRFWLTRFYHDHLEPNAREYMESQRRTQMASQYAVQWGQNAYFVLILVLFVLASKGFVASDVVAAFALVGLFVRSSVISLLNSVPVWMRARTAADKINSLHLGKERPSLFRRDDGRAPVARAPLSLQLRRVRFSYGTGDVANGDASSDAALGPIDLDLRSGELVFVTGGNGSGKTTLAKVLSGLYMPDEGTITLNGEAISVDDLDAYRRQVYALFSDFHLVAEYVQAIHAAVGPMDARTLERLGLDTPSPSDDVGRGDLATSDPATLSSGQRARLALYPLLALDRPVAIFDEWAAHQDPAFKRMFYHDLLPALRASGKLVIVITHDDRYFDLADTLVKLEAGRVVDAS